MRGTLALAAWIFLAGVAIAADPALSEREWKVDGVVRKGLVHIPESAYQSLTPIVFAFHGHGGTMANAAKSFRIHTLWPHAIVVYLQGLDTPSARDPQGKKPGWQKQPGEEDNRDLKMFDTVLKSLHAEYKVDDRRIYATGFSNGGAFTYLLWEERGDSLASVGAIGSILHAKAKLKPKPVIHVAGEADNTAKFELQKQTMEEIRKINECHGEGTLWAKVGSLVATKYGSKIGVPFVGVIHPGGHMVPAEAPELIVKFFKEHERKS